MLRSPRSRNRCNVQQSGRARVALAATAALGAFWATQSAYGQSIGLRFVGGRPTGGNVMDPTDVAGIPGFTQGNWNNLTTLNDGNTQTPNNGVYVNGPTPIVDSTGAAVNPNLNLWWGSPNTWSIYNAAQTDPNFKLMDGYLDSNGSGTGTTGTDLTNVANQPYLAVANLPTVYQQRGYKIILYTDGDGTDNRMSQYWVQAFGGSVTNSAGADLTPHIFKNDNANFAGTFVQATGTNAATATPGANYIVFDGLTTGSFVLRADEVVGGSATLRSPINGIQIVLNPPAAATTEWINPGSGQWYVASNWSGGVPNGTNTVANFLGAIQANSTVDLNNNASVRGVVFNNATNSYTISSTTGSILTFDAGGGAGATAAAQVVTGTHTIAVPVVMNSVTGFDVAAGAQLNVTQGLSGAFPLTKTGLGVMTLGGPGNYTGATQVNAGTLRLLTPNAIAPNDLSGTAGTLDLNGQSVVVQNLTGAVNITSSSAATLNFGSSATAAQTHTGIISGNVSLIKTGSDIQGLGGNNTFTGTFTIQGGTVRALVGGALGATNGATIIDGAELALWNSNIGLEPIVITDNGGTISDRGTAGGSVQLGLGGNFMNANSGVAEPIRLNGVVSGVGSVLTKIGAQGLVLSGANTYSGGTILNQGSIGFGSDSIGSTSGPIGTGGMTMAANVNLQTVNASHTVSNPITVLGNFGVLASNVPGAVLTLSGPIDLSNSLETITTATNGDAIISGKLSNGGINKDGPGTLTLTNTGNDFSGGITLTNGKLGYNDDAQLGPASQIITFAGGLLRITGNTIHNVNNRAANINWSGFSGGFDIADPANTFTVSNAIDGGGFFQKDGAGTLLLTNTNTYSGGTIVNGGILKPTISAALPDQSSMTVNGGLMDLNGFSKTFTSLNGTGGALGNSTSSPITVTVGFNDAGGSFGGAIQNGASNAPTTLIKTGSGTQALGGVNTYTGPTTISGGALLVNGSLAAGSTVTVQSGGTLGGSGTVNGPVSVQSGGTIAPGGKPGILTLSALNLASGSQLAFDLIDPGFSDQLVVSNSGGLTANGGAITLFPIAGLPLGTYPLIKYSGAVGGNVNNITLTNANVGDTTYTLNNVPGSVINLVVGTQLQTWTGAASANWNTSDANWTGAGSTYVDGKPVLFGDASTVTAINIQSAVSPSRVDFNNNLVNVGGTNVARDYTFSGASITGSAALNKDGRAKVIFNQPILTTGPANINSGVLQLNGPATYNTASAINLNATGPTPVDTTGPLAASRGGVLYFADDSVADRTGTTPIKMSGGTLVSAKGATAGPGAVTVQTINATAALNRIFTAPNGGAHVLTINNLTRDPTATIDFRSQTNPLGDPNGGAIKVNSLNGAPVPTPSPANNGLIGPWATVADNYASYDPALGVIGNVTNVVVPNPTIVDDGTSNVRNTTATNISNTSAATLSVNSLISGGDVILANNATLTVNSGGIMMSGANKWLQTVSNTTPAHVQAGPGVSQMVLTVLDPGQDHRIRWVIQDNGTPLDVIKNGDGWLRLNEANTYSGQTFVNAGTLALNTATSLGSNFSLPVIVRSGATLDLRAQTLGTREVIISGNGDSTGTGTSAATVGALINNAGGNNNAVIKLTLAGDATIGGTGRWDLRTQGTAGAVLNGGTFTLTKIGGNQISIVTPDSVSVGNIVVNAGVLSFESKSETMGDLNYTCTVNPGGILQLWNNIGGETQSKPIVLNGGLIRGQNNANTLAGPIRITQTGTLQADTQFNITNTVLGSGGILKTGGNALVLSAQNAYTGSSTVNAGTLRVTGSIAGSPVIVNTGGTFDAANTQTIPALTVNSGGTAVVTVGTLKVGNNSGAVPVTIPTGTNTGKLNIQNHALVVDYAAGNETANIQSVRSQIIAGYNGGAWNGPGIVSSTAATDPTKAIGYAQASEVLGPSGGTFQGQTADGTSVLARFTIGGDANLSGNVDFTDLVALAQNYGSDFVANPTTDSWWTHGDFNYDGKVDFTDLVKLAQNYGSALPTQAIPGAPAGFAQDLAAAFAAVPEPSTLGLMTLAATAALYRRRRRQA